MMNFIRRSMNRSEKLIDDDTGSGSPDLPQWSHTTPTSPITGRAIRPLPSRSLRSRLSDEQKRAIEFPPVPPSSSPLFESPNSHFGRTLSQTIRSTETYLTPTAPVLFEHEFGADGAQSSLGSEEEVEEVKQSIHDYYPKKMIRNPLKGKTHSPGSSIDEHDGMENYNNKKKRKVPANRDVDAILPADVGGTTASATEGDGILAGNASSGVGVSGPGRGRNSKVTAKAPKERQPLANATTQVNASVNTNSAPSSGIISNAIDNFKANRSIPKGLKDPEGNPPPQRPPRGQAQPHAFNFSYPSESGKQMGHATGIAMPQDTLKYASPRGGNAASIQTSSGANYPASQAPQQGGNASNIQENPANGQNPQQRRKPRRPGQELALAARHRRLQTEYNNFHHPPSKSDIWICEFCEYEAIFGMEPRALVRSYEVKDKKKREDAEHRRQLLEKAKAKGRKNKKGNKGQGKSAGHNSAAADPAQQPYDPHYDNMASQDFESPGEGEFYDDGYDDPEPSAAYDYEDEDGWPQETPFAKDAWAQPVPEKQVA